MALQSAWLLCWRLIARQDEARAGQALAQIGRDYCDAWLQAFALRISRRRDLRHLAVRPMAQTALARSSAGCPAS